MRERTSRRAAALAAAALVLAAGCDSGDDEGAAGTPAGRSEVTTTRVQVVEGLGREGGFDPAQIYDQLSPGVVTILSLFNGGSSLLEDGGEGGQGSGFVLDGDGYIATNAHVVTTDGADGTERADQVYIEFLDGNRVPAEIVGHDPNADVALLKVDPDGLSLTPLDLGESHTISVGEPVAAIGSPFGERQSLSIGVISALDRTIQSLTKFEIGDAIQTDAAINPGNSGGPLLDAEGRVIGVNSQIAASSARQSSGVGFAVPVDTVKEVVPQLLEGGSIERAYLGVSSRLDQNQSGAVVDIIAPGGPAASSDLRVGDRITAVDDRKIAEPADLSAAIEDHKPGERVELTVQRGGEQRTIDVRLGTRPDQVIPG